MAKVTKLPEVPEEVVKDKQAGTRQVLPRQHIPTTWLSKPSRHGT